MLTVRWPWCLFILYSNKDVENRTRRLIAKDKLSDFGTIVGVHCAKTPDLEWRARLGWERMLSLDHSPDFARTKKWILWKMHSYGFSDLPKDPISSCMDEQDDLLWEKTFKTVAGHYIGHINIASITQDSKSLWAEKDAFHHVLNHPWINPNPVPFKGKLGLWDMPCRFKPKEDYE